MRLRKGEIVDIFASVQCWSNIVMSTPTFPPTANVGPTYPCYLLHTERNTIIPRRKQVYWFGWLTSSEELSQPNQYVIFYRIKVLHVAAKRCKLYDGIIRIIYIIERNGFIMHAFCIFPFLVSFFNAHNDFKKTNKNSINSNNNNTHRRYILSILIKHLLVIYFRKLSLFGIFPFVLVCQIKRKTVYGKTKLLMNCIFN